MHSPSPSSQPDSPHLLVGHMQTLQLPSDKPIAQSPGQLSMHSPSPSSQPDSQHLPSMQYGSSGAKQNIFVQAAIWPASPQVQMLHPSYQVLQSSGQTFKSVGEGVPSETGLKVGLIVGLRDISSFGGHMQTLQLS